MRKTGFTLIELLVAITIIAILTGMGFVSYSSMPGKSRDGRRKADMAAIQGALEMYRADSPANSYPTPGAGNIIECNTKIELTGGPTYMQTVPCDPKGTSVSYAYKLYSSPPYCLGTILESETPNNCTSLGCGTMLCGAVDCNYCVTNP